MKKIKSYTLRITEDDSNFLKSVPVVERADFIREAIKEKREKQDSGSYKDQILQGVKETIKETIEETLSSKSISINAGSPKPMKEKATNNNLKNSVNEFNQGINSILN